MRIVVVLPAPFAPRNPNTSPGGDGEGDAVEGLDLAEPLPQAVDHQGHARPIPPRGRSLTARRTGRVCARAASADDCHRGRIRTGRSAPATGRMDVRRAAAQAARRHSRRPGACDHRAPRGPATTRCDGGRRPDDRVLPRGRLRPDQQLRRHRGRPAGPRPPGRVHRRGVVRRQPRGQGLRGAADAPRPAARGARGPRPVLDRLHPRHGARLPQAHDRAARRVHRAHVPGADRRREVRPPAPRGDRRRAASRTSSSRTTSSASRRSWRRGRPWVRLLSCNPAEVKDPLVAAVLVGLPGRGPVGVAGLPRRGRAGPTTTCGPTSTPSAASSGAGGLAWGPDGPDFMHESPYLNLYSYPAEADYARARRRSGRRGTGWTRPSARRTTTWELPASTSRAATAR